MAKLEDSSEHSLTLAQLHDEVLERLRAASVDDPEISAVRILEETTGINIGKFPAEEGHLITQRMAVRTDALTARRANGEPLQYVIGRWDFRYLDLAVDKRALIPRPETEEVVGRAIEMLASEAKNFEETPLIADLGTGTGAIALSIAQEVLDSQVHATDISEEALALARSNLAGLGRAAARVQLHAGDWFKALPERLKGQLHMLISNPPYVSSDYELPAVIADWEPTTALFGGGDGFRHLDLLTREGRQWLRPGGRIVLECGSDQATRLQNLLTARGYGEVETNIDMSGNQRFVTARRPLDDVEESHLAGALGALESGSLVVAPTDTLPGLLAKYDNTLAVETSYRAKARPSDQPVPVLVSGIEQAEQLIQINDEVRKLAAEHWPGALTVVAQRLSGVDPVTGGNTVGVRCPEPGWLRLLIDDVGPVTGSSANLHGVETQLVAEDAAATLAVKAGYVIPGVSKQGLASTVVDTTGKSLVVIRQGAVDLGQGQ
ncbi:MAG TPA: peptide chain release factor N(5)-glutamine methyltransferase [Acidimicrobiaceae bacterium]|nr:peptide chain release factor N(5)-glutamine methyltransferase [Acidimicrobiaceae bacterium]HAX04145.1 peptide chain release factor N(5)-glutamine methyltransferase [Acidimicrobiaceae bacterium]